MKPIVAFAVGGLVAGGVVFYTLRKQAVQEPPASSVQVSQPVAATPATPPELPAPQAQPVEVQPKEPATPAPAAKPAPRKTAPRRPSPPAVPAAPASPRAAPAAPASPPAPRAEQPPAPAVAAPPAKPADPPEPARAAPAPRTPHTVTIPAGTLFTVRIAESLSSDIHQAGESFHATLDQPLVIDSFVVAEKGARLEGRVVESSKAGRARGLAVLAVELVHLNTADGQKIAISTEPFRKQGEDNTRGDAAKVGAAAGIGAAIGAIAGGGKGAAIGAAVGGAAGTGGVLGSRGKPAELATETRLSFRLREPVTVTEKL